MSLDRTRVVLCPVRTLLIRVKNCKYVLLYAQRKRHRSNRSRERENEIVERIIFFVRVNYTVPRHVNLKEKKKRSPNTRDSRSVIMFS